MISDHSAAVEVCGLTKIFGSSEVKVEALRGNRPPGESGNSLSAARILDNRRSAHLLANTGDGVMPSGCSPGARARSLANSDSTRGRRRRKALTHSGSNCVPAFVPSSAKA